MTIYIFGEERAVTIHPTNLTEALANLGFTKLEPGRQVANNEDLYLGFQEESDLTLSRKLPGEKIVVPKDVQAKCKVDLYLKKSRR